MGNLNLSSHQQDEVLLRACGDIAVSQTVPGSLWSGRLQVNELFSHL